MYCGQILAGFRLTAGAEANNLPRKLNARKTVAPKENINHIPAEVSKVKKARILITIVADIPDTIGSKFFGIFICIFSAIKLYTF